MPTTTNLGIVLLDAAQSQKEVTINNALNTIDAAVVLIAGSTMTGALKIQRTAVTSGSPAPSLWVVQPADTGLTASVEASGITFDLSSTRQWATGALTTQRAIRILAPTYAFVGASTITTASTLSISGAPIAGTNATITNPYSLNIETGSSLFGGSVTVSVSDAGTANEPTVQTWQHRTSGTPTASFGNLILARADNASNALADQLSIATGWSAATAGSESSLVIFSVRRAGVNTEVLRLNATGNGRVQLAQDFFHANASGSIGFFNIGPVVQQANASQATITAVADTSAKAALQSFYDLLKNYGLAPATA